jgi:hypothetical protein
MAKLPCPNCIELTRLLSSATYEVMAIHREILARSRSDLPISESINLDLRRARDIMTETRDALDCHKESHERASRDVESASEAFAVRVL